MKLRGFEIRRVTMPLVAPFRTAFGIQTARDVLLVRALGVDADGWGECVAPSAPVYSAECTDGAADVLRRHLLPRLLAAGDIAAPAVAPLLGGIRGHAMAKASVEMAVLDAELRARERPLAAYLGAVRDRVDCGVSIGIYEDHGRLLGAVEEAVAEGYRRVKLKIEPGHDVAPVAAVRERFGDELVLQVDANAAYRRSDAAHLAGLDAFGLLLVEQPLPEDDLCGHAALARQLRTPVCLDESITSVAAADTALALGACAVVNIKPGRVGGYLEARRIHDLCRDRGVPVWCGGMLETGLGRAGNVALAALPNFTLPGDTSASGRYYAEDLTVPFELQEGQLQVPRGPGLGVEPRGDVLERVTTTRFTIP